MSSVNTIDSSKFRSDLVQISKQVGTDDCIRLFKLLEALKSGNKSDIDLYCRPIAAEYQNQNLKNAASNPLILAVQCADLETVKYVLEKNFDINSVDLDGLTPLHHAARLDRFDFVEFLLKQPHVDEIACDNVGRKPYQLARNTELQKFMKQHLKYRQAAIMQEFHTLLKQRKIDALDSLMDDRFAHAVIDVNQPFANSNLFPLQEFVKAKDVAIIQWLLRNGADSFRRNKNGKNAVEMCKDDQIRQILKESQNSAIINNIDSPKKPVKITGYLKKWTNYKSGYKMRWVVLDDGIMSYFKSSEDAATACRGSISLKYAKIRYDTSAKNGFEVFSGGNTKYIFKASHPIEAQRWVWAISTSIQQMKDASRSKITESVHSGTSSNYGDTASFYNVVSDKKNVSSFSLLSNDHSADNTDDDSICVGESNREEQHLDNLYFSANTLNLQLQVTNQLALGIVDELKANNIDKVAEIAQSLQLSLSSMQNAYQEIVRVAKDREVKWQKSLDHESELRRLWEDTIQKLSIEQEAMIHALEKSELERKKTKKFLKSFQEKVSVPNPPIVEDFSNDQGKDEKFILHPELLAHLQEISTSEVGSDSDDEFFDAVATGDLKLNVSDLSISAQNVENDDRVKEKEKEISISFKGYPKKIRETLDTVDDRPKLSLWSILKSMIGKDMTKMTLPVTFNEPTSLLYRAAEDMEYVNLLNIASTLDESTKRLIYVAAFAASEYSSTTLRIAKPFNPILGETFEYCRPDMKYRFLIEQVSHHPPIGAAYSESPYWEYWGESSVKSKFYGKSFDINPLGTWYLKLKYHNGEELYTWKKVTTSVVGIITGSPVVDNYGLMEIQNHTNGEKCVLNFKPRGWRAHSAYEVKGEVKKSDGSTVYTLAGHWNSKIYARGLEDRDEAFLIWQANERPPAPFNLTKFVISLNYLPKELIPWLPPTDSRFRPDQRAMEEGRYDDAAKEKERLEEAQRLRKRQREQKHIQYKPRWFVEDKHPITQELYWKYLGHYWEIRDKAGTSKLNGDKNSYWEGIEPIF